MHCAAVSSSKPAPGRARPGPSPCCMCDWCWGRTTGPTARCLRCCRPRFWWSRSPRRPHRNSRCASANDWRKRPRSLRPPIAATVGRLSCNRWPSCGRATRATAGPPWRGACNWPPMAWMRRPSPRCTAGPGVCCARSPLPAAPHSTCSSSPTRQRCASKPSTTCGGSFMHRCRLSRCPWWPAPGATPMPWRRRWSRCCGTPAHGRPNGPIWRHSRWAACSSTHAPPAWRPCSPARRARVPVPHRHWRCCLPTAPRKCWDARPTCAAG